jgi:hypothetical protein
MPDVLDGADQQQQQQQQPISPKKVLKKSLSRISLAGSEAGNAKGRRTSSKPRKNEQDNAAGPEQDKKAPATKAATSKPKSQAEIDEENKMCSVIQNAIDKIKSSLTDKQIIFGKLQLELMRMLRVFEKLQTLGSASVVDSIEAEQNVRFFGNNIFFNWAISFFKQVLNTPSHLPTVKSRLVNDSPFSNAECS